MTMRKRRKLFVFDVIYIGTKNHRAVYIGKGRKVP
jgi:hypothetical protein